MARREVVVFQGVEFVRYPDSPSKSACRYFYERTGKRAGARALHRAIWEAAHGPIPPGFHIHHVDGDTLNNDLANLALVRPDEHALEHEATVSEDFRRWRSEHLHAIRPRASEWHASEEGRQWHSEHGKRIWIGRQPVDCVCGECGKAFQSLDGRETERFCSRVCVNRHYHRTQKYYIDRPCEVCGKPFKTRPHKTQRTCSRLCGWVIRRAEKAAGL